MAKKTKDINYYEAVGRRKQSVARVRLYLPKKKGELLVNKLNIKAGEIYINGKSLEKSALKSYEKNFLSLPLTLTKNQDRFAISILVSGGGTTGRLEAMVHGVTRALEIVDKEAYRPLLKANGLLTRDPIMK